MAEPTFKFRFEKTYPAKYITFPLLPTHEEKENSFTKFFFRKCHQNLSFALIILMLIGSGL